MSDVEWGHVEIWAPAPQDGRRLTFMLDTEPPTPSGDIGGWQSITVPRHRAVRYWGSTPEAAMDIDVIVLPRPGVTVAQQLVVLRSMGSAIEGGVDARRPRQVELSGQLPPLTLKRWVIDDVSWGDAIYGDRNELLRQHLTITFGEPPDDKTVKVGAGGRSKFRNRNGKKNSKPTATLLKGETLQQFSARVLGNPARWREIANLQKPKIKDPRKPGPVGRKLKLPT